MRSLSLLLTIASLALCGAAHGGGIPVPRLPEQGVWLCRTLGTFEPGSGGGQLAKITPKGKVQRSALTSAQSAAAREALRRDLPAHASGDAHDRWWIARGKGKTRKAMLVRIDRRARQAQPIHVWSIDNANTRYWLRFTLRKAPPKQSWPCLVLGKRLLLASSVGSSGSHSHSAGFNLPRALADAAAKRFGLRRGDRRDLATPLRFGCAPVKAKVKAGQPLLMRFTATSSAKKPVYISYGGAYRGSGRNNRFRFVVEDAKGRKLPDVGRKMHFGGLGGVKPVARGKPHRVEVDLRKWVGALKPGTYRVRCSFAVELATATNLSWKQGHRRWTLKPQATSTLMVRP